jgi:hypothetical protein
MGYRIGASPRVNGYSKWIKSTRRVAPSAYSAFHATEADTAYEVTLGGEEQDDQGG